MRNPRRFLFVLLLPLTIIPALPAHADLFIQNIYISTTAEVDDLPHVGVSSTGDNAPYDLTASAETSSQRAFAHQSKGGFFHDFVSSISGVDNMNHRATTHFYVEVGADTADTPIGMEFNFFGGQAGGTAYYGAGDMQITMRQEIRAGLGTLDPSLPPGFPSPIWGFGYTVELNAPGTPDWSRRTLFEEDIEGIGLPTLTDTHLQYPSGSFTTSYSLELSAFHGSFDFGVLQPGQTFFLDYVAEVELFGKLQYPGTQAAGVAELVDPFSLNGGNPPPQLLIPGLTLPFQIIPSAPEPASLALLGLALPITLLRSVRIGVVRRRRI